MSFVCDWRDPRVKQVLILFIPVTISIGIVNLDIFLNAGFGSLVSSAAPAAINDAFRIYMLPQGIFSVAVATVLFPTLSRMAARRDANGMRRTVGNGMRQINLLLIPSAALLVVLATPITRLVYQHGTFHSGSTDLVSTALFWFSFSLPFAGVNLLLSRTFFALKRPWIPTKLAALNMVVDVIVSIALYKPLGIAGLVIGTAAANIVMTVLQLWRLRIGFNGYLEGGQTLMITVRILVGTVIMAAIARGIWVGLDHLLGESLLAQIFSVGIASRRRVRALREAHADDARARGQADPGADHARACAPGSLERCMGLYERHFSESATRARVPERGRVHDRVRHRARDHPRDQGRRRAVPQHLRGRAATSTTRRSGSSGCSGSGTCGPTRSASGSGQCRRWPSRVSATTYGIAAALTLDEFALWLDLHDDYWDKQGRKSIDAVAIFGGLLGIGVAGRGALKELGLLPKALERFVD